MTEWNTMKKTMVIALVMALGGMYWVSAAEKPMVTGTGPVDVHDYNWLDANDYAVGDKLLAVPTVPVGSRVVGGFAPGESWVKGQVIVVNDLRTMSWSLDDANNLWGWEFVAPNKPGIYYARFQAMVMEPYPSSSEYWTLAFQVVPELKMNLRWWYQYL